MSDYIIFRMEKHKSAVSLRESLNHAMREKPTPNADPDKLKDNVYFYFKNGNVLGAKTVNDTMQMYYDKRPKKIRKNAVHCLEFLVTGSPERLKLMSKEEQTQFFADSLVFIANRFGGMRNIIHAQVHHDEATPHLTVFALPLDEGGKLNARKFVGGSKFVLSQFQTDIAKEVGQKYGFIRGNIKEKPDNHIEISEFHKIATKFHEFARNPSFVSQEFIKRLAEDMAKIENKKKDEAYIKRLEMELTELKRKYDRIPEHPRKPRYEYSVDDDNEASDANRYWDISREIEARRPYLLDKQSVSEEYLKEAKDNSFIGLGKPETYLKFFINAVNKAAEKDIEKHRRLKEEEDKKKQDEIDRLRQDNIKAHAALRKNHDEIREEVRKEFIHDLNLKIREINRLNSENNDLKTTNQKYLKELQENYSQQEQVEKLTSEINRKNNELNILRENINSTEWLAKQLENLNNLQHKSHFRPRM